MKCTHCTGNHPDDFKFCPVTGREIPQELLACQNEECVDFGKHILPLDTRFCPRCGTQLNSEPVNKPTSKEYNDDSVLFVTYENMDWDEDDGYDEDSKKVRVFKDSNKAPVFEGFYPEAYSQEKKDGHDVLYFCDGKFGVEKKFNEISVLGIKKGLDYNETLQYKPSSSEVNDEKATELVLSFKKRHSYYDEVIYVGFLQQENKHIYIGCSSDNINSNNPNGADVITDRGDILFKIQDGIYPIEVLEPNYLVVGKEWGNRGVMDLRGNLLIKCENSSIENPYPNIVWDSHRDAYCDLLTNQTFDFINEHLIRKEINDESVFISRKSQKVLLKTNCDNIDSLNEEWYLCYNADFNEVLINGKTDKVIALDNGEHIIRRNFYLGHSSNEDVFISENRLVSCLQRDDSLFCEDCEEIRIRDYDGRIVQSIPGNILIKDYYKFGKAIIITDKKEIAYLDLQGNIHSVPNAFVYGEPSNENKVNIFFASDETIVINDYDEEEGHYAKIININGEVIFDNVYCIDCLSNKYLKFIHNTKWGVVDNHGNIILRDLYDDIDILK